MDRIDDEFDVETEKTLNSPVEEFNTRWPPIGQANDVEDEHSSSCNHEINLMNESDRLQLLEEEQEQLNSSLLALTTHFAQVQFRLKQIVDSPPDDKERLLQELEEFSFKGIPDVREFAHHRFPDAEDNLSEHEHEVKINQQREKQKELIDQLKSQLTDLEQFAYESGEAGLPQSIVVEKQKVLIDQLKGKLNLDLDEFDHLTADDIRLQVDQAIGQIINPAKMKEQLVGQLKTQITDLERFIDFLQGEGTAAPPHLTKMCTCNCPLHGRRKKVDDSLERSRKRGGKGSSENEIHTRTVNIMKRALALLQIFAITQFGCGSEHFHKNTLKRTARANHWGDLRAKLEMAVQQLLDIASIQEQPVDSDYTSDSEDSPIVQCNEKLTTAVRKELSMAIRDLLQHGLMPVGQSTSIVPIMGCFANRSMTAVKTMHAWDLLIKYYEIKHGKQYNSTPARKLSQSFNLEIVGGTAITPKQTLLGTIDTIMSTHTPLKRSADSHFKAFICSALNERKLVTWLRLIFRTRPLVENFYQPWSYVSKTGFEDSFRTLDKLSSFNFDLPVDLAIRQFQNIRDAF
uniref:RUN domain-containing protein n=1 Tax=Strigamia maritima TaxID=126957 RepID=T1J021_STRMM